MNFELNISGDGTKEGELLEKGTLTGDIEDKYYKSELYKKSSKMNKEKHAGLHKKRNHKADNGGCSGSGEPSQFSATRSIILQL